MPRVEARVYSTVNTWPTKRNEYAAEGVKLSALRAAQIKDQAQQIIVRVTDGYVMRITVKRAPEDTRITSQD